ncbi:RNA-binding domain-containing protein, partial [Ascodesmis nigricans]
TPGIVYLGRIPHGFYEHEMRSYFSQFGTVSRLRLSRNKKTGKSKHYAFIEFADEDVAAIVAETMNNYLLFGHILKCKVVPRDNLEYIEKLMKGANKRFKPRPAAKLAKVELEKKKPEENWEKVVQATNEKRKAMKQKWEAQGIEYD